MVLTVPALYERYENHIDKYALTGYRKVQLLYSRFDQKCITAPHNWVLELEKQKLNWWLCFLPCPVYYRFCFVSILSTQHPSFSSTDRGMLRTVQKAICLQLQVLQFKCSRKEFGVYLILYSCHRSINRLVDMNSYSLSMKMTLVITNQMQRMSEHILDPKTNSKNEMHREAGSYSMRRFHADTNFIVNTWIWWEQQWLTLEGDESSKEKKIKASANLHCALNCF